MQGVEVAILDWMQMHLRCEFLDVVMPLISWTANFGAIWILLAAVLLAIRGQQRFGGAVACGLMLNLVACNLVLKPLVGRLRPFVFNPQMTLLIAPPTDPSFPSGHTAASFAVVAALKTSGSPLWKPALVLAVLIAISRLYLYVHWPSDVLGGVVLGLAMGWLGAKLAEAISRWISLRF